MALTSVVTLFGGKNSHSSLDQKQNEIYPAFAAERFET